MSDTFKPILDSKTVEKLIPQRSPIIMVDKLLDFEDNKVVAGLTISKSNIFTDNNTFTAPGLIEHMAQSVALYNGYKYFIKNIPAPVGYIGAIKKVSILELPKAGKELVSKVEILHDIMGVLMVQVETSCEGKIVATSEMKTVIAK